MRKSPVKPVAIELADGQECKLLLTARILEEHGNSLESMTTAKTMNERIGSLLDFLWACVQDKSGLTRQSFAEQIPGNVTWLKELVEEVVSVSMPATRPTLPDVPAAGTPVQ